MTEPPQNPYQPQQPDPYQPYGAGGVPMGPPQDHPQATTVLILGILGFALCQVIAPFAWVMGSRVRKEINAAGGTIGGGQMVAVGWVLGIVGSCLLILSVLVFVAYIVIVIIAVGASATTP